MCRGPRRFGSSQIGVPSDRVGDELVVPVVPYWINRDAAGRDGYLLLNEVDAFRREIVALHALMARTAQGAFGFRRPIDPATPSTQSRNDWRAGSERPGILTGSPHSAARATVLRTFVPLPDSRLPSIMSIPATTKQRSADRLPNFLDRALSRLGNDRRGPVGFPLCARPG
jgi:hypothetical protein